MGGKNIIGKSIAEQIQQLNTENLPYLEPFCGMMGVTRHIQGPKIVTDFNESLVRMWKGVFDNTLIFPKEVSREEFNQFRSSNEHSALKGFVLASCCFSGNYGVSYGLDYKGGDQKLRRATNGINHVKSMITELTILDSGSYDELHPSGMCIYCDPPYQHTTQTPYITKFDSLKFWDVMREWSKTNLVIISELKAPEDFKCVWEKEIKGTAGLSTTRRSRVGSSNGGRIEKLFIYSPSNSI